MQVSGIFLEKSGVNRPNSSQWIEGFALLERSFARHAIKPSYFSVDNYEGLGKLHRYDGLGLGALPFAALESADYVALAATPNGQSKPGWNWNAQCELAYLDSYRRLTLTFMIEHAHFEFGSPEFEGTLRQLATSNEWDFGFAMVREKERGIEMYLGGIGKGSGFDKEDNRRSDLWYSCYQPEERRNRVRDIFPYNMVGPKHLAQTLPDGRSLRTFIETDPYSELRPLADDLWLWKVKADCTETLRAKLSGSGIVITE